MIFALINIFTGDNHIIFSDVNVFIVFKCNKKLVTGIGKNKKITFKRKPRVQRLDDINHNKKDCDCSNCVDHKNGCSNKNGCSKSCPNCKSDSSQEANEDEPAKETLSLERSLFVCSNCGAFIGLTGTHCNACGARRSPITAKIDVSSEDEASSEEGNSIIDKLLESPTDLFLCESCGAFMGSKAEKCEICGAKVDEIEVSDSEEEIMGLDDIEDTITHDILSSEGSISLCSNCGAFIKPESTNCGICGAVTEEIMSFEEEIESENKLSSSGTLYMCESCGAFTTHKSKICSTCGEKAGKDEEYEEDFLGEEEFEEEVETSTVITSVFPELSKKILTEISQDEPPKKVPERIQKEILETAFKKAPIEKPEPRIKKPQEKSVITSTKRTKANVVDDCKRLWLKKAVALKKLGSYNRALKSLNRALSLSPDDKRLILEKADIFYELKRYESASKHYRLLLELEPDNIMIWNKLGNALFRLGYQNESRSCYEKALSLDANNREAIINKGYLFIKLERYDEAVECAMKVVA